jgi:hypothetical protein
MINKIKLFFKRLFCKHEFTWCVKNEMFHCISGETQYLVCLKCGKVQDILNLIKCVLYRIVKERSKNND